MVKVKSSSGGFVNVEIKGVSQALDFLRKKGKDIENGIDLSAFQAANYVQSELQESIIGNRAEPKSVDTGKFGNSISLDKINNGIYSIYPKKETYPGTSTTTQDVALILEYGTSNLAPRSHFRNTQARTKQDVIKIVKGGIK